MSKNIAISVQNVSKSFKLPHERHTGLKQAALNFRPGKKYEVQHVLNDISFDIEHGEFFGIVGRNGSGKSTLLKVLAQIYHPEQGGVAINGTLTPFIELGVGFNPELTGRENVYLNGALLGFDRKQIDEMYEAIVDFAEISEFMDQKLKNYSSGMQVRLAFAIAVRAESDILLIDEVLAVGDSAFQNKCLEYFRQIKHKKTVVFVTHDMNAVSNFCDRVAVIDRGDLIHLGDVPGAIEKYYGQFTHPSDKGEQVKLFKGNVEFMETDLTVTLQFVDKLPDCEGIGLALFSEGGDYVFGTNTFIDSSPLNDKGMKLVFDNAKEALLPGRYYFKVGFFGKTDMQIIQFYDKQLEFTNEGSTRYHGVANLEHNWKPLI